MKKTEGKSTKVRTRFAPSPTGFLHIGGLRTALYSYAFAKSRGGDFLLRIEDTDVKREVKGATEAIYGMLERFNLVWDEGPKVGGPYTPYIQSERVKKGIYKKYADKLLEGEYAYRCFCKPKTKKEIEKAHEKDIIEVRDPCRKLKKSEVDRKLKDGESFAIRLKVPDEGRVSFKDFILKKEISWECRHVDDAMLLKSNGFPTYHLAAMVDDHLMEISHIIRGRDWLPSTPIHLLLFKYLGLTRPEIGHLTDILDPGGGKLSKRKGTVAVEEFLDQGYLPEAILNFVMLLGWAPKDDREMYSLDEFVENFKKGELQTANPVFNRDKLDWFNGEYIRKMDKKELSKKFEKRNAVFRKASEEKKFKITSLVQDRIKTLNEFDELAGFFFSAPKVDKNLLGEKYKVHLNKALKKLKALDKWELEEINGALMGLIKGEEFKTGKFFMDLRIAITGGKVTPPINESIEILGKKETIARLENIVD